VRVYHAQEIVVKIFFGIVLHSTQIVGMQLFVFEVFWPQNRYRFLFLFYAP